MSRLRKGAIPDKGADIKIATGIKIPLTHDSHPQFIHSLRTTGDGRFELLPSHDEFAWMLNVRVLRVRAWIYSLEARDKLHSVVITHTGPETIHDAVTKDFRYDSSNIGAPKAIFEAEGGGTDGDLTGDDYAPIGPFTTWRVFIPKGAGVKHDKIEQVVMEYHVLRHPMTLPAP
jgi:hypothetical protein